MSERIHRTVAGMLVTVRCVTETMIGQITGFRQIRKVFLPSQGKRVRGIYYFYYNSTVRSEMKVDKRKTRTVRH